MNLCNFIYLRCVWCIQVLCVTKFRTCSGIRNKSLFTASTSHDFFWFIHPSISPSPSSVLLQSSTFVWLFFYCLRFWFWFLSLRSSSSTWCPVCSSSSPRSLSACSSLFSSLFSLLFAFAMLSLVLSWMHAAFSSYSAYSSWTSCFPFVCTYWNVVCRALASLSFVSLAFPSTHLL